jgi:riboflavin synthase
MFTGLVQALGTLTELTPSAAGARLRVDLAELATQPISLGDSICVAGVCLTVVHLAGNIASFDVITETLQRTSLGDRAVGDKLNLELSLTPTSFMGGHFVQGHIDSVGTVEYVAAEEENWRITVGIERSIRPLVVPKGSITIEGVSMTIASTDPAGSTFTLAVIPTTLQRTTLGKLEYGQRVNLETDILARTVVHWLAMQTGDALGARVGSADAPPGAGGIGINLASLLSQGFS